MNGHWLIAGLALLVFVLARIAETILSNWGVNWLSWVPVRAAVSAASPGAAS